MDREAGLCPSCAVQTAAWHMCPTQSSLTVGGGLVAKSCPTLVTLWTAARQASLSMEFSRQEYWSGLPFHSPGDLPNPGMEPESPSLQANYLPAELQVRFCTAVSPALHSNWMDV